MLVVLILVGSTVYLFTGNLKLKRENADLQTQAEKTGRKAEAIKKKYTEQKAVAASMQRAKMAADSQMRTLESEMAAAEETITELTNAGNALKIELRKKEESLKLAMQDKQKAYKELEGRLEASVKALSDAEEIILKNKAELADLMNVKSDLEGQLEEASSKIDRVVVHNEKLAELSMEVLAEFDDRNVFESLLEKEPFTQAKRVDLEKMIQEYIDRIEDDELSESDM